MDKSMNKRLLSNKKQNSKDIQGLAIAKPCKY